MPDAPTLPAITCARCGYTLAGLPITAACPECATPATDSIRTDDTPPGWIELGTRALLRPGVLWSDPLPLHRAGLRLVVNTHLTILGFAGATGTWLGLPLFAGVWHQEGALSALVQAPVGLFIVGVIAAVVTLLTGVCVHVALDVGVQGLIAVVSWARPARPPEHATAIASCALYPIIAGAAAAWLVVAITAALLITILAFGGTPNLERTCFVTGGILLAATAAASILHSITLATWGALDPRPSKHS